MAKRYSQPQIGTPIDWGNPRTRGLVYAWVPAISQLTKFGAVGRDVNRQGVGSNTNGSSTYEFMNTAPVFSLDECSLTAILTPQSITTASSYAVACGQNASGNPLFMIGNGATSNQLGFRTRDSANTDISSEGVSADWANGLTTVVSGTRSKTAALQRVFAAGKQVASTAVGTAAATTFDRFAIGCLLRSSAALYWSGTTNLVLIHNRALSDAEIKSLSDNPWQIFQPTNRAIYPVAAGGGAGNATGSLASIIIDAATGTATGKATATATPASVSITAPAATATGGAVGNATGALSGVTLAGPSATASGKAQATTTPASVTLVSPTATAAGKGQASGALAAVSLVAPTGTASASAGSTGNATASPASINIAPPSATATGAAAAFAAFMSVILTPVSGTASSGVIQVAGAVTRDRRTQESSRPHSVSTSRPGRIANTTR